MTSLKNIKMYLKNPVKLLVRVGHNTFLRRMSDESYLKLKFKDTLGYPLNLEHPKTFNEKLQWLKINDRKDEYIKMVDKYEAKEYAANIIGREHIIPTLGVWDAFSEIDFDSLPKQFVLKCTHDSGGLVICRDKSKLDLEKARIKIEKCLKQNYYWSGREWPYKGVKPRIIAEQYMENEMDPNSDIKGLVDYKFFCFGGEPRMLYISQGLENHATARISFYDLEGNEMPFHRSDYRPLESVTLPGNYPDMKEMARLLAGTIDSPFVRIDLYSIKGQIYFSEITFSPCSGMVPFEPKEWDEKLGGWINLDA